MRTILLALLVLGAAQCAYPTDSFVLRPGPPEDTGLPPDDAGAEAPAEDVPVATDQGDDGAFDVPAEPGLDAPADLAGDVTVVPLDRPADLGADLPRDLPVDRPPDVRCPTGQANCGGVCRNLQSDPAACGDCRTPCLTPDNVTTTCSFGDCHYTCLQLYGDCNHTWTDGCETELSDPRNCGSCGRRCSGGYLCDCTAEHCNCRPPY